jgi:hypothetical protein
VPSYQETTTKGTEADNRAIVYDSQTPMGKFRNYLSEL